MEAVENWRFEKRMPSRAAAARELLRRGLAADGFLVAEKRNKSQDFGVLETKANGGGDGSSPAIEPPGLAPKARRLAIALSEIPFACAARAGRIGSPTYWRPHRTFLLRNRSLESVHDTRTDHRR